MYPSNSIYTDPTFTRKWTQSSFPWLSVLPWAMNSLILPEAPCPLDLPSADSFVLQAVLVILWIFVKLKIWQMRQWLHPVQICDHQHSMSWLGIPGSHAFSWDYDMQGHLHCNFKGALIQQINLPIRWDIAAFVCSADSAVVVFIIPYLWAVWNNGTIIELEIPDHPGDHMRRLEAWLHHEQLKSTGYAAPALEYLAWVPWIGRSGCKNTYL